MAPSLSLRSVPGWEDWYAVTDHGDVVSFHSDPPRVMAWAGPYLSKKPSSKSGVNSGTRLPYPQVGLSACGVRKGRYVHVMVLEAWVGSCPPGMEARHLDDDPTHPYLTNLAWGTKQEQTEDKRAHRRRIRDAEN